MMQEPGTSLESALTVLHFTAQTYAQPTTTTHLMIERIIDPQTLNQVVEVVKDVPVERITEQIIEIVKEGDSTLNPQHRIRADPHTHARTHTHTVAMEKVLEHAAPPHTHQHKNTHTTWMEKETDMHLRIQKETDTHVRIHAHQCRWRMSLPHPHTHTHTQCRSRR